MSQKISVHVMLSPLRGHMARSDTEEFDGRFIFYFLGIPHPDFQSGFHWLAIPAVVNKGFPFPTPTSVLVVSCLVVFTHSNEAKLNLKIDLILFP